MSVVLSIEDVGPCKKRLKIGVARSIGEALDALEQRASGVRPSLLNRLSKIVGWD